MPALAADDRDLALAHAGSRACRHLVRPRPAVRRATDLSGVGDVCAPAADPPRGAARARRRGTARSPRATAGVLSRRGQRRIAGSISGSRLIGRNAPSNSNSSRSISTAFCSCPASYDQPIRDHSTVCSHGAIVAVGSILIVRRAARRPRRRRPGARRRAAARAREAASLVARERVRHRSRVAAAR